MALTLITPPPSLAPCRNEVWVEYGCGAYRTGTTTVNAAIFITRWATPAAGHTIYITLPGGEVVAMTAVSGAADDSGNQYTIGSMLQLANALNKNVAFSSLYMAQAVSGFPQVVIGGRWPSVTLPPSITFSAVGPYTLDEAQNNQNYVYAPGYSVRSRLWIEREWLSDQWDPLPTGDHYPYADLRARENVAPLLLPYLGYDWPEYGRSTPMRTLAPLRRFRVQAWERYGMPASDKVATTYSNKVAWFAGQRQRDTPTQAFWHTTLANAGILTPWLTYRGRAGRHEVSAAQQHVLGWYRNSGQLAGVTMLMRITVHYTDGTETATNTLTDAGMVWGSGEIALFPCGFNTLALQALEPTKVPYKYTAQLMRSTGGVETAVSELHTFWLVDDDVAELHLEYVNSLGVVESVRCTGAWEQGLATKFADIQRQRTIVEGAMPPASTSNARQLLQEAANTLHVSTGYHDEAEAIAICDILFSPEVRLVDHANQRHLPLLRTSASHAVARRGADTNEHLYALNLQFQVGDAEQAWGERALMPMTTETVITPGGEGGIVE